MEGAGIYPSVNFGEEWGRGSRGDGDTNFPDRKKDGDPLHYGRIALKQALLAIAELIVWGVERWHVSRVGALPPAPG